MGPRRQQLAMVAGFVLAGLTLTDAGAAIRTLAEDQDWSPMRLTPGLVTKPAVTWLTSPNCDARPADTRIDMIVIHDTETPGVTDARAIWRHFARPASHVSAHYVIGKAGEIVQCVPDQLRAWHAGESYLDGQDGLNDTSLGIELVNAQTGRDPFTTAQYRSLVALVSYLVAEYQVPRSRIVGHKDITLKPHVKHDPAPNFSWGRFLDGVSFTLAEATTRQAHAEQP